MRKGLSVFFPVFNGQENIESVVKSAPEFLPSLARCYEIIVVNNGSQDKTGQIADLLSQQHKKVSVVHNFTNRG